MQYVLEIYVTIIISITYLKCISTGLISVKLNRYVFR